MMFLHLTRQNLAGTVACLSVHDAAAWDRVEQPPFQSCPCAGTNATASCCGVKYDRHMLIYASQNDS